MDEQATTEAPENNVVLDEQNKLVLRCQKCGHFLAEVICNVAILKILCKANPCKTYNIFTINKSEVSIKLEAKKDTIQY